MCLRALFRIVSTLVIGSAFVMSFSVGKKRAYFAEVFSSVRWQTVDTRGGMPLFMSKPVFDK
jgi:hypothetical protein